MHLGVIISEYRAKYRLSMDDFANRSGLSKSYISMLEKNINPSTGKEIAPTIDAIKKIANAMNMDFNDLFKLLEDDPINLEMNEEFINHNIANEDSQEIRIIARAAKEMTPEQRKKMLNILKASFEEEFPDISDDVNKGE
ncbi:MAG: helix-turn-helix transcriptional regulator [Anaerorhabdus sp.]